MNLSNWGSFITGKLFNEILNLKYSKVFNNKGEVHLLFYVNYDKIIDIDWNKFLSLFKNIFFNSIITNLQVYVPIILLVLYLI